MFYQKQIRRPLYRWLSVLLAITLVITMSPALQQTAYAGTKAAVSSLKTETPEILVSGDSIIGGSAYTKDNISLEKAYTRQQMKAMAGVKEQGYSAVNSSGTQKLYKATGVYLTSLLKGTKFDAAKDELQLIASDGYTKSLKLGEKRYYFPQILSGSQSGKTEVQTILSWANDNSGTKLPDAAGSEQETCTVIAGQTAMDDINNPLYNKNMQKVIGGKELKGAAITVDGEPYTRGEILLKERADYSYTYSSKGGENTDYVRGVPLAVLLDGYDQKAAVTFGTADNYPVEGAPTTVGELISGNYMLAYEKGTSAGDLKGIFETAKNDSSITGYFTLYGDGFKPAKMIDSISVTGSSGNSYANSPYKHITNGGKQDADGPYNIDGITGATLTIEGPGVKNSVPLSVRDLEGQNKGVYRGDYTDTRKGTSTEKTYEGIDLYYILNSMASGSSGIILTDTAKKVQIKNRLRKTIATFTLDQVKALHDKERPILVAYGTSETNGTNIRPFVFDGASGADKTLGNEDGCLKLVYDKKAISGDLNSDYTEFGNMAYIYVAEDASPGYKHNKAPYNTAENSQYVLTVTGKEIGREVNYTVQQLENMVKYSGSAPEAGGFGHRDEYSMANSSYWYVNEYEGVKLWDLLQMSGIAASKASDSQTKVRFSATDGYTAFDEFSLKQVADPNSFGYYEKNAADNNDGTYKPVKDDLKKTGYPVLVAYGVNGYPYVIKNTLDGYLSGLSNDGGPLRIISGKTEYNHANGSNQAKLLDKILAGADTYHYSTHKYHEKDVYKKQAEAKLQIKVLNGSDADAPVLKETAYKVGEIEDILYDGSLPGAQLSEAKVKAFYENGSSSDLYEGVNLNYFLKNVVEIPGYKGTIIFSDGTKEVSMNLQDVLALDNGYNPSTKLSGLSPVLAYGKNGAPMVASQSADGYEGEVTLGSGKYTNKISVKNDGGPLSILIPNSAKTAKDAQALSNVTSITIKLSPDNYAHLKEPYSAYQKNTIKVSGEGTRLSGTKEFTLTELEGKQSLAATGTYSILKSGSQTPAQLRYRGTSLYDFLNSTAVGLKTSADKVKITSRDGKTAEFSLSDVRKADYLNSVTKEKNLKMILAYGSADAANTNEEDGRPLVKDKNSQGYEAAYQNSGGPLKLVVGQKDAKDANSSKMLQDVTAIEVTASAMSNWNHSSSEIFKQYLKDKLTLQVVNNEGKTLMEKAYTVEALEKMTSLIEREEITATSTNTWEGLNMWKFVRKETSNISGMEDPISVTVSAKDGFSKDLRSIFGMDGLENGIADGKRRVPILLAYGMDGYPLASGSKSNPNGEGYDSLIGNNGGPIRLMTHGNQGACLQETVKIVVKVNGSVINGGQQEKPVTFNVTPADGKSLPLAGIRSIRFDNKGGMWIGTYGGGAAYKAKGASKFTIYDKDSSPALETGFVSAVAPDKNGGVWMSQNASYTEPTANKGVVYLKDGKLTAYRAADIPATIPDDYVQDIKIDDKGCVWFASFGGLTKYDPAAKTWKTWNKSDGFPAMSVDKIEFDGNGGLWCGFYPDGAGTAADPFTGGFAHMDKNGKITAYKETASVDPASGQSKLAEVWIRDIAVDKNGEAWITASGAYANIENTGGTLWHVKAPGAKADKYTGDQLFGKALDGAANAEIRMVEADAAGGLWFGTSADGILYVKSPKLTAAKAFTVTAEYSTETGAWKDELLNNIYSLDRNGTVIYAGSSGGLASLDYAQAGKTQNINQAKQIVAKKITLKKKSASYNKVSLSWSKVSGASGYVVTRATAKKGPYKTIAKLTKDTANRYTDKKVKTGGKYYYKVRAYKKITEGTFYGAYSAAAGAKPALAKVKTVKAKASGKSALQVKWSKVSGAKGYVLYKASSKKGTYKKVKAVKGTSYTVKKLKSGKTYYFKVKAYRSVGGKNVYGASSSAAGAKTKK